MSDKNSATVEIADGRIRCKFDSWYRVEENGMFSWHVPGFDIYFSSKTKEDGMKRSAAMTKMFVKYWVEKVSFREFILQLHKLGFKAPQNHEFTISQLMHRKISNAKFKSNNHAPQKFENSSVAEMDLAI